MQTLDELIASSPVFAGLPADHLALIAGCAKNAGFEEGKLLFREGDEADTFYVVRRGRVALELHTPERGGLGDRDRRPRRRRRLVVALPPVPLALRRAGLRGRAGHRFRRSVPAREVRGGHGARLRAHAAVRAGPRSTASTTPASGSWTSTVASPSAEAPRGAMTPVPYRVRSASARPTTRGRSELDALGDAVRPRAGQFDMLHAFSVGEVPISTSHVHDGDGAVTHTIRAVGHVTNALCSLDEGAIVGVRGPFGSEWPLTEAAGGDLVVVAGGIGLAPLPPAIRHALARREDYGAVAVLLGARTPDDLLFRDEVEQWRSRLDAEVDVTVDAAAPGWRGRVGLVTTLVPGAVFDPASATVLVCVPEIMMVFVVRALLERGVPNRADLDLDGAQHALRRGPLRALPARPRARLSRRPRLPRGRDDVPARGAGAVSAVATRPKLAVWKFSSCDGCQLSASSTARTSCSRSRKGSRSRTSRRRRAPRSRPLRRLAGRGLDHDAHDAERIKEIREQSAPGHDRRLRHCRRHPGATELCRRAGLDPPVVYARTRVRPGPSPRRRRSPTTSPSTWSSAGAPSRQAAAPRDRLRPAPARPRILPATSVCTECKARGTPCVMVAEVARPAWAP